MPNRTVIDSGKLIDNIHTIKSSLPEHCKLAAVIKGDAYGHGMRGIAEILDKESAVEMFVTASFYEATKLYETNINKSTLILNREPVKEIQAVLERCDTPKRKLLLSKVIFSVYSYSGLQDYEELCTDTTVNVHLRLDFESGLKGFDKDDFEKVRNRIGDNGRVKISGIYAHIYPAYSGDEDKTIGEIESYAKIFNSFDIDIRKNLTFHLCSSSLCFQHPEYTFDMVRVGAFMYGIGTGEESDKPAVQEILSVYGTVLKTAELKPGTQTDYSGKMPGNVQKVALLSFGSWDLPFVLLCKDPVVRIRGKLFNIVGIPCMDTCIADITGNDDIIEFDEVQIIGNTFGIRFSDWIDRSMFGFGNCQTLFSGIERIPKVYIEGDDERR